MPKKSLSKPTSPAHSFEACVLSKVRSKRSAVPKTFNPAVALEQTVVNGQTLSQLVTPLLCTITKDARCSRLPSEFAQKFFQLLTDTLGLTSACLRQVAGPDPELRFVQFKCAKAKDEPRVFSITIPKDKIPNVIVNATNEKMPIIDGNQLLNENNLKNCLGQAPDTGSIISFPFTDELDTRWLFTSCRFEKLDAFEVGHLALLHTLFPVFTANYNAIAFREACRLVPQFAIALDMQRHEDRRTRIGQLLKSIKYDNVFVVTLRESEDQMFDQSQIVWQYFDGNKDDSLAETRAGKDLILQVASENPQASFTVSREKNQLVFTCRDNLEIPPLEAPEDWSLDRYVAMIPIDLGNNEPFAYVWVECKEAPTAETLLEIDQNRDRYEADMRAVQGLLPFRDYGEEALAEETLTQAIEHAVQQANEPVLIEGPHGTGKLKYARQIHTKLFPENPLSAAATSSTYRVLSPLTKPKRVLELLAEPGVVVLYRVDEFKRKLQIELLRIVSELDLPDGKPLRAKLIFLLSTSEFVGEDGLSPRAIPGFHSRLRNACIYIRLKNLSESSERIPDLIHHHLKECLTSDGKPRTVHESVIADFKRYVWDGNLPQLYRVLREMLRNAGDAPQLTVQHYPTWFELPDAELDGEALKRGWFIFEHLSNKISLDELKSNFHKKFNVHLPKHQNTYKQMAVKAAIQKGIGFDEAVKAVNIKSGKTLMSNMKKFYDAYKNKNSASDADEAMQ